MNVIPTLISASDLQRDSARIIGLAKSSDDPVIVVKNNKPQAAFVSLKKLQFLMDRIEDLETKDALEAIKIGEEERRRGKLVTLKLPRAFPENSSFCPKKKDWPPLKK